MQHATPTTKCRSGVHAGGGDAILSGGVSAMSYVSFVASVITLVLNINNSLNANNNNNNRLNVNYGSSSNTATSVNQNVGNDFNIMLPPGRKRRRKRRSRLPDMVPAVMGECLPEGTLYDALLQPFGGGLADSWS